MTWKEIVDQATILTGPNPSLTRLYEAVQKVAPTRVSKTKHWKAKVRQTLGPLVGRIDRIFTHPTQPAQPTVLEKKFYQPKSGDKIRILPPVKPNQSKCHRVGCKKTPLAGASRCPEHETANKTAALKFHRGVTAAKKSICFLFSQYGKAIVTRAFEKVCKNPPVMLPKRTWR